MVDREGKWKLSKLPCIAEDGKITSVAALLLAAEKMLPIMKEYALISAKIRSVARYEHLLASAWQSSEQTLQKLYGLGYVKLDHVSSVRREYHYTFSIFGTEYDGYR
eukprot:gene20673-26499_t